MRINKTQAMLSINDRKLELRLMPIRYSPYKSANAHIFHLVSHESCLFTLNNRFWLNIVAFPQCLLFVT